MSEHNNNNQAKDEDEIELDDEDVEETKQQEVKNSENIVELDEEKTKTKADEIRLRLRKLKQKMAQARQLNKVAVKEEGERLNVSDKERKKQAATVAKKRSAEEWEAHHSKVIEIALNENINVDYKLLTVPASSTIENKRKQAEKQELNQFNVNDYHNPEGQYRNYVRNLKSLPRDLPRQDDHSTFDPIQHQLDFVQEDTDGIATNERDGARRLANEMHRRIEKRQKREREKVRKEIVQDTNVSHINQRNKRFNEKINRTYDAHTAEIRQNLERGTAL